MGLAFLVSYVQIHTNPENVVQSEQALSANPVLQSAQDPSELCDHLYQSICEIEGDTPDPTGVVHSDAEGELQAINTLEQIKRAHPDWSNEQIDEELVRTIYTPQRRSRIQFAYKWVLSAMESYIDRQKHFVFSEEEKTHLKARLRKSELQLPPPAAVYADEPHLFTKNDVFYERLASGKTRLRVGGAYFLTAKSWFNMVFTIAHELAHSIDPCEIRIARPRISLPAYDRLSACFLRNGVIATRTTRSECGENDQLSETFADWMAVQVTAQALRQFASEFRGRQLMNALTNSVRDLCEQDEGSSLDMAYHPAPQTRIEGIFGRNPTIRKLLKCQVPKAGPEHCSFESPY